MKKLMLIYKIGFSILALAAVYKEFLDINHTFFGITNFFSFFTIESNIFGAVILLISAYFTASSRVSQKFNYLRGAAALYMVITGIVYTTLLSGSGHSWMNTVLHYILPVVMALDWLLDRSAPLRLTKALWWLAFPVIFLVYSLVRGPIANWYPYPFLDPRQQGYLKVAVTSVIIAIAGVVLTLLLAKYTQLGVPISTKKRT